jgi:nitroreductase
MAQEEKSFNQVLNERRSIRAFKNNAEVDATKLHKIQETCDMAPSSRGLQTFQIYQIKNEDLKRSWLQPPMIRHLFLKLH